MVWCGEGVRWVLCDLGEKQRLLSRSERGSNLGVWLVGEVTSIRLQ